MPKQQAGAEESSLSGIESERACKGGEGKKSFVAGIRWEWGEIIVESHDTEDQDAMISE